MIRSVIPDDAREIARIYNYYVENTAITFETEAVDSDQMRERIIETIDILPWFVYLENDRLVAYCYAGKWKGRCAYRHSVESTVYLDHAMKGKGIGKQLYEVLIDELRKRHFHTIIAGIALPNPQSIGLHEKFGFQKVAHFEEVGRKFEKWIDVGYWQLTFEE